MEKSKKEKKGGGIREKNKAIFNLIPTEDFQDVQGTRETLEKSKEEFETLFRNIEKILKVY